MKSLDIQLSGILSEQLAAEEAQDLIAQFQWWKQPGFDDLRLHKSYMFSHDKESDFPKVGRPSIFRHCHLVPNSDGLNEWMMEFDEDSKKRASDRVLFYAQKGKRVLLMLIVGEPGGHKFMRSDDNMIALARMAERFMHPGLPSCFT